MKGIFFQKAHDSLLVAMQYLISQFYTLLFMISGSAFGPVNVASLPRGPIECQNVLGPQPPGLHQLSNHLQWKMDLIYNKVRSSSNFHGEKILVGQSKRSFQICLSNLTPGKNLLLKNSKFDRMSDQIVSSPSTSVRIFLACVRWIPHPCLPAIFIFCQLG